MSKLTLDYETLAKLRAATGPCELYDPHGNLVGHLTPAPGMKMSVPEFGMTDDELERRLNDPNTKWHTPDEVMARLRSLRKEK